MLQNLAGCLASPDWQQEPCLSTMPVLQQIEVTLMAEMEADSTVPARLEELAELAGARFVALGALLVALQPDVAMLQLGPAGTSGCGQVLMHEFWCRASRTPNRPVKDTRKPCIPATHLQSLPDRCRRPRRCYKCLRCCSRCCSCTQKCCRGGWQGECSQSGCHTPAEACAVDSGFLHCFAIIWEGGGDLGSYMPSGLSGLSSPQATAGLRCRCASTSNSHCCWRCHP